MAHYTVHSSPFKQSSIIFYLLSTHTHTHSERDGDSRIKGDGATLGKHIYKCAINIDLINLLTSISTHTAITAQVSVCASPPKRKKSQILEMPSSCNLMGGNPPILGGSSSSIEIAVRGLRWASCGGVWFKEGFVG